MKQGFDYDAKPLFVGLQPRKNSDNTKDPENAPFNPSISSQKEVQELLKINMESFSGYEYNEENR